MLLRRVMVHVKTQNWTAVALDFVIVVVGVFIGIQVANWNAARGERTLSNEYLSGFRQDLLADAHMLQTEIEARQAQRQDALTVLEFYDGRSLEPIVFFEAYGAAILARNTRPNRNTIDEVLNTGSLRLVRDPEIRNGLLDLYVIYKRIADVEDHMARDFDAYLYDPTFSSVPFNLEGPWEDTPASRLEAETLLNSVTIENGFRLIVANLQFPDSGLEAELEAARVQVDTLLREISSD